MEKEIYWSRFAADFETHNHYVAGQKNIAAIKDTLSEQNLTGKVLELGCGNGTYTKVIAHKAQEVFATDFSEEMVSVSKTKLDPLKNVCVEQQDCFSLTYPDSSFDAVVMVNLLHVVENPEDVIKECKRVLKQQGILIIVSFTTEGMSALAKLGLIYRYLKTYGKPPATSQSLTLEKTSSMVTNQGFDVSETFLTGHSSKAIFVKALLK